MCDHNHHKNPICCHFKSVDPPLQEAAHPLPVLPPRLFDLVQSLHNCATFRGPVVAGPHCPSELYSSFTGLATSSIAHSTSTCTHPCHLLWYQTCH